MESVKKIKLGENRFIEFKEKLPKYETIAKTILSFSNGGGGNIFIGVRDNGEIIGVDENELLNIPDKVSDIIYSFCYPLIIPDIYTENINGKNIVIIKIFPGSLKPYFLKTKGKNKGTYVRIGAENKIADNEFLLELERNSRNVGFDEEVNYNFNINEIDISFLENIFKIKANKKITKNDLINLKLIREENGKQYPTNALLILSGKLDNTYTDCARFKGITVNSFIDKKEFKGNLFEQIELIENFLKNHLNLNAEIKGFTREDTYEIPIPALREAVLNAFIHREYGRSGSNIKIAIFDDILEITSPGLLPLSINILNIFTSKRSEVRNKVIAKVFKELKYIEQWGTGMGRIFNYCEEADLNNPEIKENGNFVQFVFHRLKTPIKSNNTDKTPIKSKNTDKMDSNYKIIKYLENNNQITNKVARSITDLTNDGVKSMFKRMTEKGLIEKNGSKKGTYYTLK